MSWFAFVSVICLLAFGCDRVVHIAVAQFPYDYNPFPYQYGDSPYNYNYNYNYNYPNNYNLNNNNWRQHQRTGGNHWHRGYGGGVPHSRPNRQSNKFDYNQSGANIGRQTNPFFANLGKNGYQPNGRFGNNNPYHNNFGNQYWRHAHRASPRRYRNFMKVFRDVERENQSNNQFNATAEDAETDDDFNGRSMAAPGQYPHMAAIGFRSNAERVTFKCGGSLISELYVLTAAHCCEINGEAPYMVKLGDINLHKFEWDLIPQRRFVANYYRFPDYNVSLHYHDIALIQMNRPVEYTEFVRPIRLWANDEIPYERVYTMGYGSTSFAQAPTNILTELPLSIVSLEKCNTLMPRDESAPNGIIDAQICAKDYIKNRDTCQGDSGGPLQLNLERRHKRRYGNRFRYYLVGIISYGGFCRGHLPGVYTRVSSYIDWIASIVWPQYFDFETK